MSCPEWFAVSKSSNVASPFTLKLSTQILSLAAVTSESSGQLCDPSCRTRKAHPPEKTLPKGDPQELRWDTSSHLRCHHRRLGLPRGGWGETQWEDEQIESKPVWNGENRQPRFPQAFRRPATRPLPRGILRGMLLCGSHAAHRSASSHDPAVTTPPA